MTAETASPARSKQLGNPPMRGRSSLSRLALRGLAAGAIAGTIGALALGTQAGAQGIAGFNSNQPVNYAAGEDDNPAIEVVDAGGVALRRGTDTLNGGRLTMDLNSGISSVDGRGGTAPGGTSGRVSGSFSVPDQD